MLQDIHLVLFVLVLVSVDVVLITVWYYNDPLETKNTVLNKLVIFRPQCFVRISYTCCNSSLES